MPPNITKRLARKDLYLGRDARGLLWDVRRDRMTGVWLAFCTQAPGRIVAKSIGEISKKLAQPFDANQVNS